MYIYIEVYRGIYSYVLWFFRRARYSDIGERSVRRINLSDDVDETVTDASGSDVVVMRRIVQEVNGHRVVVMEVGPSDVGLNTEPHDTAVNNRLVLSDSLWYLKTLIQIIRHVIEKIVSVWSDSWYMYYLKIKFSENCQFAQADGLQRAGISPVTGIKAFFVVFFS